MIGAEIEDRYRVESELGAGGVGTVYRAVHLKLRRPVALKVLQERFGKNRELRQRFEREARALAALSHPHIVTITDYGVFEDMPYLVMELLEGVSLDERLKEGRLEPDLVWHVMRQLLSALEFAHDTGLVHRDVKPGNVFLQAVPGSKPHVKLLDFGLAKFLDPQGQRGLVTRAGQIVGTPWYMAPEQIGGQGKSASTDVYSAGIILFEMLSGKTPFQGDAQEVMRQHLLVPLPALESICPDRVPTPELDALLRRATAKRMQDRFENAGEMARALDTLPDPAFLRTPPSAQESPSAPEPAMSPAINAVVQEGKAEGNEDEAATLHFEPAQRSFGNAVRRLVHFVWRTAVFVVFTISLTAMLGAAGVVLVLAKPDVSERWPMLNEVLRALPGLGQLVPEREQEPTSAESVKPGGSPSPSPPPSAVVRRANDVTAPAQSPNVAAASPSSAATAPAPSAAPGPPLWSKIPSPIGRYHRIVESSRALSKWEMKAIHKYNAAHPDDPRGHLVLARSHMRRGWRRDAFVAYTGAYKTSPRAREDVHMLPDVISLVAFGMRDGPEFVKEAYGKDALGAVEQALGERQPSADAVERLERLRDELRSL